MQADPGKWPSHEEALSRISNLNEGDLNAIRDHDHYVKPRIDSLNSRLHKIEANMAVRANVVDKIEQKRQEAPNPHRKIRKRW
jgi:hypothetical protein